MKLHLPITLRRALLAVMAALAASPAVAHTHVHTDTTNTLAGTNRTIDSDYNAVNGTSTDDWYYREKTGGFIIPVYEYTHHSHLEMTGTASNKIVSKDLNVSGITVPGFVLGMSQPNVQVNGNIAMSTTNGYNAIVGSVTGTVTLDFGWPFNAVKVGGGRPNVTAGGDVVMNGPANAVMLGSTINGTNITLNNTGNQTTTIGKVTDGVLGSFGADMVPANMKGIEGIFNIVQGSKLKATGSVTLNTATDTAVNKLKANIIAGGQGDLSAKVNEMLNDKVGESLAESFGPDINNSIKNNDSGSSITAGTDINLLGGASVIVDTTLSDLVNYGKSNDLASLLAGNENSSTTVTLKAGRDLNLDSIINMAYGAQGGVELKAGTAEGVVGAINATGAFNIIGGKTTLEADSINLAPTKAVSVNQLVGELGQFGDLLPVDKDTFTSLTDKLGDFAKQPISANIVAGGANLSAEQNITTGGTLGLLVNTPVSSVMSSLMSYMDHQQETYMIYELLQPGTATTVTSANGNIELGSQLNLVHGGGFTETAGQNALVISAANGAVNLQGTANVVSGNVVVEANGINMTGERLPSELKSAVSGLLGMGTENSAEGAADSTAGIAGILDKVLTKGNANIVTGGATLTAGTGGITMSDVPVDSIDATGAINAVLDTELVDLVDAFMERKTDSLVEGGSHQTTLKSEGNINMLGRVNVVNGGKVVLDAQGDVNLQGSASLISGGATVTANSININTDGAEKYKMYFDSEELGSLGLDGLDLSSISGMGVNAGIVAGGANLTATGKDGIKIGGTAGIMVNTKVSDLVGALGTLQEGHEMSFAKDVLSSGTATKVEASNGNIELGAQLNLVHGGNLADKNAALTITANNGAVTLQGTGNVVSGNVVVEADGINLTGERLPADMAALGGLVGDVAGGFVDSIPGVGSMLDKLVQKGSVNVVTGGATLTAGAGGITMSDIPVDAVGATGAINAVLDTQFTDVISAVVNGEPSAILPTDKTDVIKATTTLESEGDIDMLGRVNVVAGLRGNVVLDAEGDVEMQGSISMVAGNATVDAKKDININTDEADKYKMHLDAAELGGLPLPGALEGVLGNMGLVNAAVVAGGANLTADGDITTGGTAGILLNTPMADVIKEFNPFSTTKNPSELEIVQSLLQKGTATTVHADGNINLGSQLNLAHGGGFMEDGANALTLSAGNSVKMGGTFNVVSGNTTVDAKGINLTGERLPANLAGMGEFVTGLAGELIDGLPAAANGMMDKLVQKGAVNVVTGGATLTAGTDGITMSGVHETGAINAVLDTDLAGVLGAMMGDNAQTGVKDALIAGGSHQTTLKSEGNIDMLGRVNVVNGGKVVLDAQGAVNLQGNASLISGGATVKGKNININTDESADYKIYFDSTELGGLVSANSPFAPIVDSISGMGVNAGIVAGGAELTAQDNITIGGTLGLVVNTPLSAVMTEVLSYLDHNQETWMAYKLLQPGVATTVTAENGDIEVGAQFNLLHGGGFTETAGENALVLSAANGAVNVEGTFNVISGNTQVTAQEINLTGEVLPADMAGVAGGVVDGVVDSFVGELPAAADSLLDRLVAKGNGNIVTGGATLTATGEKGITMSGAANAVIDTELVDVIDAFMQRSTKPLEDGGNHMTTLTSAGNIDMLGRLNVVNGAYVKLDAAKDVNLKGTLNVVSGKATVEGNNINLVGQQNLGLDWESLLPGDVGNYMDQMGITNKLDKGVNGNLVLGGAKLNADNDITISGMASVVTNTPVGSAFEALNKKLDNDWYPELWLVKEILAEGIATTLNAGNNIVLDSRLNVLHGGKFAANGANALALTAGNTVKLDGTLNMVSGNVTVDAQNIELKGGKNIGLDLSLVVDKALGADYTELAKDSGMIDKIANKGLNANVVMGGATLKAKNDITMNGMANAVLDTELTDVVDFVEKGGDPASLVEGGSHKTTLTATDGNINMLGRLNVVNGGQVELKAGQTVKLEGTANLISGNAKVNGKDIELNGKSNVALNWGELIPDKYAGYGELAEKMGILDKANGGVNGNVVAGGAKLTAENDISINGMAGAVVDTTPGSVMEALQNMVGTPLLEGETEDTTLTAGGNINMNTRLNVVNGGKTTLDAGKDVNLGGTFNVVATNANVNAGGNINMTAKNKVGVDISPLLNGHYAELAEEMGMTDVFKNGVSSNVVAGGAKLNAEGDVVMSGVATAIVDTTINNVIGAVKGDNLGSLMQGGRNTTTVTAGNDIKLESQINVVNGGNSKNAGGVVLNAGNDVILGGDINVVNRATVNAGNNVDFGGDLNVLKNATIAAQSAVSFTNTNAEMTNGSISAGDGVFIDNSVLVNTVSSDVTIDGVVYLANGARIENYGSLSLTEAAVVNATFYSDSADTVVNGALTLKSATFVITSDTLTLNETGIDLSLAGDALNVNDVPTVFSDSAVADAVAGVNFVISSELLEGTDGKFEFILFENATENDYTKMLAAIQADEVSITLSDLNRNALLGNDIAVEYINNNIVVTGSAAVPEPATATLSLLALAALAARRRRQK